MAYGELKAVDGVSFEVAEGEFFGILGPNGAGKTTTLEMIEGLRKPDAGTIRVLGESPWPRNPGAAAADRRAAAGVVVLRAADRARADPHLRRAVRRRPPPAATSGWSGSGWSTRRTPASRTSRVARPSGSRSPVRWCTTRRWCSSTSRPPSLDPQARRNLWDLLSGLNDSGRTVVLTTHYMDEAEVLCDRVAIMDHGRILELDTPALVRAWTRRPGSRHPAADATRPGSRRRRGRRGRRAGARRATVAVPSAEARRRRGADRHPRGRLPRPHRAGVPRMTGGAGPFACRSRSCAASCATRRRCSSRSSSR